MAAAVVGVAVAAAVVGAAVTAARRPQIKRGATFVVQHSAVAVRHLDQAVRDVDARLTAVRRMCWELSTVAAGSCSGQAVQAGRGE